MIDIEINNAQEVTALLERLAQATAHRAPLMRSIVGTNEPYAAIHQLGGKAGRGRKVAIPARPFLILTPQDEADILEDIQDYFQRLIK